MMPNLLKHSLIQTEPLSGKRVLTLMTPENSSSGQNFTSFL